MADLTGNGSRTSSTPTRGSIASWSITAPLNSTVLADRATGLLDPGAVRLVDLNGDGIPDLVVANSGNNDVLIYPGLGNGQFGPAIDGEDGYFVGTDPVGITVAYLTGCPARPGDRRRGLQPGVDPAEYVAARRRRSRSRTARG